MFYTVKKKQKDVTALVHFFRMFLEFHIEEPPETMRRALECGVSAVDLLLNRERVCYDFFLLRSCKSKFFMLPISISALQKRGTACKS